VAICGFIDNTIGHVWSLHQWWGNGECWGSGVDTDDGILRVTEVEKDTTM
jgi:hypothetical protein